MNPYHPPGAQPSLAALFKRFAGARFWLLWLLVGGLRALSWLPLPLVYWLGAACGEIAHCAHRPRRDITRRNLRACFPDKSEGEIRALARAHFRALVAAVFASGIGWWGRRARLNRLTRLTNRDILDDARRRGDNIILLAPHFVGLEYGGIYLSTVGPLVSMYQRNKNQMLDALIKAHRSRFGAVQYDRREAAASMLKTIRRGCPFYYLPDQDPGRNKGVFAPFYNIPTATFTALGRIAGLSNARVIPCITRLLPAGRGFEIIFHPPLANYPSGNDIADATTMNHAVESLISHAPEQYFWSHRRFKTRPEGEAGFYR